MKFAGCAGVATGSILVYAYILMYYTKTRGFENQWFFSEGFENQWFLKEGFLLLPPAFLIENLTQIMGFLDAGCAGVATGSILVYAYILM